MKQTGKLRLRWKKPPELACPVKPLIDIRTAQEMKMGVPSGAIPMTADEVLSKYLRRSSEGPEQGAYILCAVGVRSLSLVRPTPEPGPGWFFQRGRRIPGLDASRPADRLSTGRLNAGQADRYSRHLVMPQLGPEGQRKLLGLPNAAGGTGRTELRRQRCIWQRRA